MGETVYTAKFMLNYALLIFEMYHFLCITIVMALLALQEAASTMMDREY